MPSHTSESSWAQDPGTHAHLRLGLGGPLTPAYAQEPCRGSGSPTLLPAVVHQSSRHQQDWKFFCLTGRVHLWAGATETTAQTTVGECVCGLTTCHQRDPEGTTPGIPQSDQSTWTKGRHKSTEPDPGHQLDWQLCVSRIPLSSPKCAGASGECIQMVPDPTASRTISMSWCFNSWEQPRACRDPRGMCTEPDYMPPVRLSGHLTQEFLRAVPSGPECA